MKLSTLISAIAIISLFTACGPTYDDYYYEEEGMYGDLYEDMSEDEIAELEAHMGGAYAQQTGNNMDQRNVATRYSNNVGNGKVEMRPLIDTKTGKVTAYAPLPANWKTGKTWQGPQGTMVETKQGGMATAQQRPLNSIDQLIQQYIMPEIRRSGAQVRNMIDLPGIARNNQKNHAQYWQAMPTRFVHQVKGIEMTYPGSGKKSLVIVNLILSSNSYGGLNTYYSTILTANPSRYETDKKTLIFALENLELDPQMVAAYNQSEQQKSQVSWAAHNQRMRQNQANFDAWQQTQQTLSDVNDIYYEGYQNRSRMNDAGHQKTINGIWEQESGTNPYNGQQMNTSIHNKYNYVNQYGQVFGTNNPNYNPALDPNMNHMEWRKVQR